MTAPGDDQGDAAEPDDSVTVRFAGSGDAFGSGGRFQACISVQAAGRHLLLDCGASSLIALKRLGIDPGSVDAVLVSHLHGDHFAGIPFLILDGQFTRRERPLLLAGPPGMADRLTLATDVLYPGSSAVRRRFPVEIVELAPDETVTLLGTVQVTPFLVAHPSAAPAYAYRLAVADRVVAYSGDTAWTDHLIDVAREADLFICEAYTDDKLVPHHLSLATLRAERHRLDCRRLILTHAGPDLLAHRADLDEQLADDGLTIRL